MEDVLDEVVSSDDLKKYEKVYHEEQMKGAVSTKAHFEYAWCLVRSKYPCDIKKGILLLQELYNSHREGRRDYLYYLAIGNARIKEYSKALRYIRDFQKIEPGNQQVLTLENQINKRMEKEGLIGMAFAGGAVLAIGGLLGLGIALARKVKSTSSSETKK